MNETGKTIRECDKKYLRKVNIKMGKLQEERQRSGQKSAKKKIDILTVN